MKTIQQIAETKCLYNKHPHEQPCLLETDDVREIFIEYLLQFHVTKPACAILGEIRNELHK